MNSMQSLERLFSIGNEVIMSRKPYMAPGVVIIDGQDGCGKTLFSQTVSAFDRVELLSYCYELEYICTLQYLGRMQMDAAVVLARMLTDLKLYNHMMGRETNLRPADLSSIWKSPHAWKYLRRLLMKGDEHTPKRVVAEKPILALTVHNLLPVGEPVFQGLQERLTFIEIVRHPLYMIRQQMVSNDMLIDDARDFRLYVKYRDREVPFWAAGWEERFLKSSVADKAIYTMNFFTRFNNLRREELKEKYRSQLITIPFERFVIEPSDYLEQMKNAMGSAITDVTRRMLKKQNVPRKMYAEGVAMPIYKRSGWEPPKVGNTEEDEFAVRRNDVAGQCSPEALKVIDELSYDYEGQYLGGQKNVPGRD